MNYTKRIIKLGEESLSRVLTFYNNNGTPLSYFPKLQYINGVYPQRPNVLAMIREELEIMIQSFDFFSHNLAKTIWKDAYKIDVSDEAIAEVIEIEKDKLGRIFVPSKFESEADILLFLPYRDHTVEQEDRDEILAHEVWHLIEKERGALQEHPLISEGTATYAMKRFRGQSCDRTFEECNDYFTMIYSGAANVVQSYVGNAENPYQTMLDRKMRDQIQEDLLGRVRPVLVEKVKRSLGDKNNQKAMAQALRQIPEFQKLDGNLTAAGIIEAYREMGAEKLADELQGKSLEGLLYWFRLAGF